MAVLPVNPMRTSSMASWRMLFVGLALILPGHGLSADGAAQRRYWESVFSTAPGEGPVNSNWERWERCRAQYAKSTNADQGAVAFLGDSITFHWDLAKAFPALKTANRGISGDTTRGMLFRLQEDVLDLHPRLIVLLCGVNDLSEAMAGRGGSPQGIANNVRAMLERIGAALPGTPVIVCELMPAQKRGLAEANAAVDALLPAFPHAHRLKWLGRFQQSDDTQNPSLFKDGTHPNAAGYAVWQSVLEPELARLLSKPGIPEHHPVTPSDR
jgi:lysophospholipase L1-like esterase